MECSVTEIIPCLKCEFIKRELVDTTKKEIYNLFCEFEQLLAISPSIEESKKNKLVEIFKNLLPEYYYVRQINLLFLEYINKDVSSLLIEDEQLSSKWSVIFNLIKTCITSASTATASSMRSY